MKIIWPLALMLLIASSARTSRILYSLEERIGQADLIVVGSLSEVVPNRFSVTFHRYFMVPAEVEGRGERDTQFFYNIGEIEVERVLKGKWTEEAITFAYFGHVEVDGRWSSFSTLSPIRLTEGDRRVFILQSSEGYAPVRYRIKFPENLVPTDSLETVEQIIGNVDE